MPALQQRGLFVKLSCSNSQGYAAESISSTHIVLDCFFISSLKSLGINNSKIVFASSPLQLLSVLISSSSTSMISGLVCRSCCSTLALPVLQEKRKADSSFLSSSSLCSSIDIRLHQSLSSSIGIRMRLPNNFFMRFFGTRIFNTFSSSTSILLKIYRHCRQRSSNISTNSMCCINCKPSSFSSSVL